MPEISVIIPVYNVEKYLERCLESVINQTFKDIEIICVNDGSTDTSVEILKEFSAKDDRIKIINQENGGLSAARNTGLDNSCGKYIAFVDSDDYIDPNTLETAYKAINDDPEIGFVSYGAKIIADGIEESARVVQDALGYHKIRLKGKLKLDKDTIIESTVTVWNKLFRKELTKGIYFPKGLLYEDNAFFRCYILHCKYAYYLDEYFYYYIQRPNSIMERQVKGESGKIHDRLIIFEKIYEYYKKFNKIEENKELLYEDFKLFLLCDYMFCKKENKKAVLLYAKNVVDKLDDDFIKGCDVLVNVKKKRFNNLRYLGLRPSKIFDLYNTGNHKILEILGIKIKFKRKIK